MKTLQKAVDTLWRVKRLAELTKLIDTAAKQGDDKQAQEYADEWVSLLMGDSKMPVLQ